ncbi:hypothetical protein GC177_10640 [bacterium]|nr:hypothetical protein [bacterium]
MFWNNKPNPSVSTASISLMEHFSGLIRHPVSASLLHHLHDSKASIFAKTPHGTIVFTPEELLRTPAEAMQDVVFLCKFASYAYAAHGQAVPQNMSMDGLRQLFGEQQPVFAELYNQAEWRMQAYPGGMDGYIRSKCEAIDHLGLEYPLGLAYSVSQGIPIYMGHGSTIADSYNPQNFSEVTPQEAACLGSSLGLCSPRPRAVFLPHSSTMRHSDPLNHTIVEELAHNMDMPMTGYGFIFSSKPQYHAALQDDKKHVLDLRRALEYLRDDPRLPIKDIPVDFTTRATLEKIAKYHKCNPMSQARVCEILERVEFVLHMIEPTHPAYNSGVYKPDLHSRNTADRLMAMLPGSENRQMESMLRHAEAFAKSISYIHGDAQTEPGHACRVEFILPKTCQFLLQQVQPEIVRTVQTGLDYKNIQVDPEIVDQHFNFEIRPKALAHAMEAQTNPSVTGIGGWGTPVFQ